MSAAGWNCRCCLLAGCAGLLFATAAWAGQEGFQRPGPTVMTAPSSPARIPVQEPWVDLHRALQRAKRDRIVLFWESIINDRVDTIYRSVESISRNGAGGVTAESSIVRRRNSVDGTSASDFSYQENQTTQSWVEPDRAQTTASESRPLAEQAAETQFMDQLRRGGLRFVDRSLSNRLEAASVSEVRPNLQSIEARAWKQHADYLMQVTSMHDAGAATGRVFRVSLKDVQTGQTLMDFMTEAPVRQERQRRFIATDDGYARAPMPAPTNQQIITQLALEVGGRMNAALASNSGR